MMLNMPLLSLQVFFYPDLHEPEFEDLSPFTQKHGHIHVFTVLNVFQPDCVQYILLNTTPLLSA